jgi:unsaturated rhamnogalacturonyl hydrolase
MRLPIPNLAFCPTPGTALPNVRLLLAASAVLVAACWARAAQASDREIVLRVADYVVNHTSGQLIDQQTGETFESGAGRPVRDGIGIKDQYNFWQYPNAIINLAMFDLAAATGERKYREFPVRFYDFFFRNADYLRQLYDAGFRRWEYSWYFRMDQPDTCGPHAAGLIEVQRIDPRTVYQDFIERTAALITSPGYQLADGTWAKPKPRIGTIWIDDLYMGVSFLAKYGAVYGRPEAWDFAVRQVIQFDRYLYDPVSGLYYHNYYTDLRRPGLAHWGRANGWFALAQVSLLDVLPRDHPQRAALLALLDRQVYGLSRHQGESGLWHQLLDKTDSFLETSGSAMFTYAIARAINEGWIDRRYSSIALAGWEGVKSRVDGDGAILGVCQQTGISDTLTFYYRRQTPFNDFHATGTIIRAGLEIIRLKETARDPAR